MKYQSRMRNVPCGTDEELRAKAEVHSILPVYCQAHCHRPPFGQYIGKILRQVRNFLKQRPKIAGLKILSVM